MTVFTKSELQSAQETAKTFIKRSQKKSFYELCFCLCSPQTKFANNQSVNRVLRQIDFYSTNISKSQLTKILKPVRFYNNKTRYLMYAKDHWSDVWSILKSQGMTTGLKRRELVALLPGLGYKTASHFLRNTLGLSNLAIIDTHILNFLGATTPKNSREYLELESRFHNIAKGLRLSVLELDLIIFAKGSGVQIENVR